MGNHLKLVILFMLIILISITCTHPQYLLGKPTLVADKNLRIDKIFAAPIKPTTMAFMGLNEFLILERNEGKVYRVTNGVMNPNPLLDVNVATDGYRGMNGIATSTSNNITIFSYISPKLITETVMIQIN